MWVDGTNTEIQLARSLPVTNAANEPCPNPPRNTFLHRRAEIFWHGVPMKIRFATLLLAISLLACSLCVTQFTGCATGALRTTQAAGTVSITVDAAMQSWGEWVRAGKATVAQRIKVRDAYAKYQGAMHAAEAVTLLAISTPGDKQSREVALNAVTAASAELVNLITNYKK